MSNRVRLYLCVGVVATALVVWPLSNGARQQPAGERGKDVQGAANLKAAAATKPASRESDMSQSARPILPEEFAVITKRSAFGRAAMAGARATGGPEAGFVFKGVVQADDAFTAFIEDVTAKQILQLGIGQAVARGRIKSIDLDSLEYEIPGDVRQIQVGQNLDGLTPPPPATAPSAPPPRKGAPRGGPPMNMPNGPEMQGAPNAPPTAMPEDQR
jgi:hypothetical protein